MENSRSLPYLTENQIRNQYANRYNLFEGQKQKEADRASAKVNTQYDTAQRQNYINYRTNQKELPELMARQGLTGGASETSALRSQTNYENSYNNTERSRNNDLTNIHNTLADALSNYKMTADQNMADAIEQNRQLQVQYEKQLQQEREQRFANNISGFNTVDKVDAAIANAKRTGEDWKIPYLENQRNAVIEKQKAEAQALQEREEQRFANTISGWNTISGIDAEIDRLRKNPQLGEAWKIPYLRARRAELMAADIASSSSSSGGGGGYSYSSGGGYSSGGSSSGGSRIGYAATSTARTSGSSLGRTVTRAASSTPRRTLGRNLFARYTR